MQSHREFLNTKIIKKYLKKGTHADNADNADTHTHTHAQAHPRTGTHTHTLVIIELASTCGTCTTLLMCKSLDH